MKKLLCVIICLFISCFALSACNGGNGSANNSQSESNRDSQTLNQSSDSSTQGGGNSSTQGGGNSSTQGGGNSSTQGGGNSSTQGGGNSSTQGGDNSSTQGGDYPEVSEGDIYLSPTGSDVNSGSKEKPMYSLSRAAEMITAGHTIFMMPGTYNYDSRINFSKSGEENKPITVQAYEWGEVVLDFRKQPYGKNDSNYVGIMLKGNYWKIQGLTVCHAGDNGIKVEGSHNYIGRCVLHHNGDTGIQLGFGHNDSNPNGELCAYNTIENCDSYLNYDFDNHGDADGFACKMHNGKGNVFIGCRAWRNCDDAWDLFETDWAVEIINCWAWESGNDEDFANDEFYSDPEYLADKSGIITVTRPKDAGNGNGIKLGGDGSGGNSKGQHIVRNCISFGNDITGSVKGFDENSHSGGVIVENCVAWDNGYNFMFEKDSGNKIFRNNISFYTGNGTQKPNRAPGEIYGNAVIENNNFTADGGDLKMTVTVTADDFISISEEDALAPRQADGSLPNNGFGKLKESSQAYKLKMGLLY